MATLMSVDFKDKILSINNQSCSFQEAGISELISSEYEFKQEDCDNHLIDKHKEWGDDIEFEFINSKRYFVKPCYENNEIEIISPERLKSIIANLSKEEVIRDLVDSEGTEENSQTYGVKAEAYIDLEDGSVNFRKVYPNQSSTRENLYVTVFQYTLSNDGWSSEELLGDDDKKAISFETYEKYGSDFARYWEELEECEDSNYRVICFNSTAFTPKEWCLNILGESIKDYKMRESNCEDSFIEGLLQDDYNWMCDFNEDDVYDNADVEE